MKRDTKKVKAVTLMLTASLEDYILYLKGISPQLKHAN